MLTALSKNYIVNHRTPGTLPYDATRYHRRASLAHPPGCPHAIEHARTHRPVGPPSALADICTRFVDAMVGFNPRKIVATFTTHDMIYV